MRQNRQYLYWGLTAFAVVCGVLVFYDIVFRNSILFWYLGRLITILAPVSYGFVMAYLLTPVVNGIEKLLFPDPRKRRGKLPRAVSIFATWVLVLMGFYVLLRLLLPQLYASIVSLVGNMETYYNTIVGWVQKFLEDNPASKDWIVNMIDTYYQDAIHWFRNTMLPQLQTALTELTTHVTTGILGVFNFFKNLLVGIIVSVYLLAMKEGFAAAGCKLVYSLFSKERSAQIIRGTKEVNQIFSGFVRGKLLDAMVIGSLCFVGCSIMGIPYTPLVSVIMGVTNVIPFFGPFLGAIPSGFIILLDNPVKCLYFIIYILILQQLDGNVIEPKILGGRTGIPSFWVIVAILIGGGLWGLLGMFIGVPLFACIYTGVRRFCAYRLKKKGLPVHAYNYRTHAPVSDEELRAQEGKAREQQVEEKAAPAEGSAEEDEGAKREEPPEEGDKEKKEK